MQEHNSGTAYLCQVYNRAISNRVPVIRIPLSIFRDSNSRPLICAPVSTGDFLRPAVSISQVIKTRNGSMEFVGWVVTKLL
jgi:hypothetical protein